MLDVAAAVAFAAATPIEWSVLSKNHQNCGNYYIWHIALEGLRKDMFSHSAFFFSLYTYKRTYLVVVHGECIKWLPLQSYPNGRSKRGIHTDARSQQNPNRQWTYTKRQTERERGREKERWKNVYEDVHIVTVLNSIWVFASAAVSLAHTFAMSAKLNALFVCNTNSTFGCFSIFNCLQLCKMVGFCTNFNVLLFVAANVAALFLLMQLMSVRYSVPRVSRDAPNASVQLVYWSFLHSNVSHFPPFSLLFLSRAHSPHPIPFCMFTDYAFWFETKDVRAAFALFRMACCAKHTHREREQCVMFSSKSRDFSVFDYKFLDNWPLRVFAFQAFVHSLRVAHTISWTATTVPNNSS